MHTLIEIYQLLRSEGLCSTQAEFSENWLGHSWHYMSQIGGDPRKASPASLQLLASRLDMAATKAKETWCPASSKRLQGAFEELERFLCDDTEVTRARPYFDVKARIN
ncbi:hypothetical protein GRI69_15535 [Erythrobacter vulgaris]|uniref:Uncharacterized protein n=1 Tax=Qipengyuania vulgaris TaxID=291985 RepID=A0A844XXL7_9SPHN|nr:DUF6626 family protein [Qipengyuania vulgaris]MXO49662.1 hypothetical protein [Qipengyuania vulgaris]